ncbi:MAG: AAA family ATPase [Pantoea sp. Brub]|nr:AAA family ATPase [Pantoea sp. Brub]
MTTIQLTWDVLQPDSSKYKSIFSSIQEKETDFFSIVQPRLLNGLQCLQNQINGFPLLLVSGQENKDYLSIVAQMTKNNLNISSKLFGGTYQITSNKIMLGPPVDIKNPFTTDGGIYFTDWVNMQLLFGCVRIYNNNIQLEPGIIHRANGGTLIIALKPLVEKPLLWFYLKRFIEQGYAEWISKDHLGPLPILIPPMPLTLKLILCGDITSIEKFRTMDSDAYNIAIYTQFEESIKIIDHLSMLAWYNWSINLLKKINLSIPKEDFWPELIKEGVRFTKDKEILPLCPIWLLRQFRESALIMNKILNAKSLSKSLEMRLWRENYLNNLIQEEIIKDQIVIKTKGEVIGQINGLSIIEYPGNPRIWGLPLRITCVLNPGENEFLDVESKCDLSGNIHTKSIMIIQSYLIAKLKKQIPFTMSLVFEQSYSEVDGDSASLAILCVIVSALSNCPINQQIAVTGSIDQLGNVQPIGGLNEKIESFFNLCFNRKLTGKQGVIIPQQNVRHLSLNNNVIMAVKNNHFHIWTISHAEEAFPLLIGKTWYEEKQEDCLLSIIQKRLNKKNILPKYTWPIIFNKIKSWI